MDFEAFVLNPATLLVIVFGLVEFVKQFGAKGNGLRVLSLGLGISMAVAFKVREIVPDWALWIELGFFGLAVGLAASGVYGFLDGRLPKVEGLELSVLKWRCYPFLRIGINSSGIDLGDCITSFAMTI